MLAYIIVYCLILSCVVTYFRSQKSQERDKAWFRGSQRLNALPVHLLRQVYKIGVLLRTSFKNGDTSEYSTIGYHPFRRDKKQTISVLKIVTIPLGSTPITNSRVFFVSIVWTQAFHVWIQATTISWHPYHVFCFWSLIGSTPHTLSRKSGGWVPTKWRSQVSRSKSQVSRLRSTGTGTGIGIGIVIGIAIDLYRYGYG